MQFMQWRDWPPKITPLPVCVTTPNVVALDQTVHVRINSGKPAKLGFARATPPWVGGRGWPPSPSPRPIRLFSVKEGSHREP